MQTTRQSPSCAGGLQRRHVPGVQQVEAAAGGHHRAAGRAYRATPRRPPRPRRRARRRGRDRRRQRPRRAAAAPSPLPAGHVRRRLGDRLLHRLGDQRAPRQGERWRRRRTGHRPRRCPRRRPAGAGTTSGVAPRRRQSSAPSRAQGHRDRAGAASAGAAPGRPAAAVASRVAPGATAASSARLGLVRGHQAHRREPAPGPADAGPRPPAPRAAASAARSVGLPGDAPAVVADQHRGGAGDHPQRRLGRLAGRPGGAAPVVVAAAPGHRARSRSFSGVPPRSGERDTPARRPSGAARAAGHRPRRRPARCTSTTSAPGAAAANTAASAGAAGAVARARRPSSTGTGASGQSRFAAPSTSPVEQGVTDAPPAVPSRCPPHHAATC